MGNREELLEIFKENPRLAELNPGVAAEVLSGKTPESLIPARLPRLDPSQQNPLPETFPSTGRPTRQKYGNVSVQHGSIRYDSTKEAKRHQELLILERAGAITNLVLKPNFVFEHNGFRIASFTPDFQYEQNGQTVIEDVKGIDKKTGKKPTATDGYRLRKKLLKAFFGFDVVEV